MDELSILTSKHKPYYIFITENWLKSSIPNSIFKLDNYKILRNDRKYKKGVGVCVYIKKDFNYETENFDNIPPKINLLAFSSNNALRVIVYIPPRLSSCLLYTSPSPRD